MSRVFVTGIGLISALGKNVDENLHCLRKSVTGIKSPVHFKSKYASLFLFGEVAAGNNELKELTASAGEKGITRTCLLAYKAFDEAVEDAGLSLKDISSPDTAFISASTVGGMCEHDNLFKDANLKSETPDYLPYYGCGAHTLRIACKYGMKGYTDTINTACSSSANAVMLGAKLIKAKRAKRVIVGGADSLAKYTVNGFNALKILAETACKPFDENRTGLTLGEGAAYLVLEAEENIAGKKVYGTLAGYGNSNDAFHTSALSDEATGVIISIEKAMRTANLKPSEIDYINAHGTGTENNDKVEITGLAKIFGKVPPYNSTKSYTGHTLAAAGAIEAVISLSCIQHKELYKSLNCDSPVSPFNIPPTGEYKQGVEINNVLSNSFGFAGNCTALVFSKV